MNNENEAQENRMSDVEWVKQITLIEIRTLKSREQTYLHRIQKNAHKISKEFSGDYIRAYMKEMNSDFAELQHVRGELQVYLNIANGLKLDYKAYDNHIG